MSKEVTLAENVRDVVKYMEDTYPKLDGIDKIVLIKTVAAYYDALVAAEVTRTMIIQTWGKTK